MNEELPKVSVIVPIRNEERDLPRCIAGLEALDYPCDRFEVLLVDDQSTDNSAAVIANAVERNQHFHHLSTANFSSPLRVKARPVDLGARHATGEWLLIIDADGAPRPRWLRTLMEAVQPHDGLVSGPFIVLPRGVHGRIEALVNGLLIAFCFGAAGLGLSIPGIGPNMAIRRRVYEQGGGLACAKPFVAEDIALWHLCERQLASTRAVLHPDATVRVTATQSLRGLLSQHHRWLSGCSQDSPPSLKRTLAIAAAFGWLGSVCSVYGFWYPSAVWGIGLGVRASIDFLVLCCMRRRCRTGLPLAWFPLAHLYLVCALLILPVLLCFSRRLTWRGDNYVEHLQLAKF